MSNNAPTLTYINQHVSTSLDSSHISGMLKLIPRSRLIQGSAVRFVRFQSDLIIKDKYLILRETYDPTKYPIVLCHGLSGFDTLLKSDAIKDLPKIDYFKGVKQALVALGCQVHITRVPPFGTISERAQALYESTKDLGPINLICHSMGGLDARYLIHKNPNNHDVKSLTTISTPHRGSEVADFVLNSTLPPLSYLLPQSIRELTTTHMAEFNEKVFDDPKVLYFSYGAQFNPNWFSVFMPGWYIIKMLHPTKQFANDGMVTVESSKWGTYLGTLDQVDHMDLINWTNRLRALFDKAWFNTDPKFNALALYLDIMDNLSKRGL